MKTIVRKCFTPATIISTTFGLRYRKMVITNFLCYNCRFHIVMTSGQRFNSTFLTAWSAVGMEIDSDMVDVFAAPMSRIFINPGQQHTFQTFRVDQHHTSGAEHESVQHDQIRLLSDTAPPKRFYRTFWRSIARRLLEQVHPKVIDKLPTEEQEMDCEMA